jgi:hypothetical protein
MILFMPDVFARSETNLRRKRQRRHRQGEGRRGLQGPAAFYRGDSGARDEGAGHAAGRHSQGASDRTGLGVSGAVSESRTLIVPGTIGDGRPLLPGTAHEDEASAR